MEYKPLAKLEKMIITMGNKLVFMFQKNIASNLESNRSSKKYKRWFDFATKTKDDNNNVNDFTEFTKDKVFSEVIKRLRRDKLTDDDIKYIESEEEHIKLTQDFYLKQKLQLDEREQEGIYIGVGIGVDKGIGIGVKKEKAKNKAEKNKMIKNMESKGLSVEAISDLTGLSLEEIKNIKADD
ncbi:hypothetical protein [Thiospirochaeta perfilievii]|nr:hypothetical protein [Thiospirochaeta perfilievii]